MAIITIVKIIKEIITFVLVFVFAFSVFSVCVNVFRIWLIFIVYVTIRSAPLEAFSSWLFEATGYSRFLVWDPTGANDNVYLASLRHF